MRCFAGIDGRLLLRRRWSALLGFASTLLGLSARMRSFSLRHDRFPLSRHFLPLVLGGIVPAQTWTRSIGFLAGLDCADVLHRWSLAWIESRIFLVKGNLAVADLTFFNHEFSTGRVVCSLTTKAVAILLQMHVGLQGLVPDLERRLPVP